MLRGPVGAARWWGLISSHIYEQITCSMCHHVFSKLLLLSTVFFIYGWGPCSGAQYWQPVELSWTLLTDSLFLFHPWKAPTDPHADMLTCDITNRLNLCFCIRVENLLEYSQLRKTRFESSSCSVFASSHFFLLHLPEQRRISAADLQICVVCLQRWKITNDVYSRYWSPFDLFVLLKVDFITWVLY